MWVALAQGTCSTHRLKSRERVVSPLLHASSLRRARIRTVHRRIESVLKCEQGTASSPGEHYMRTGLFLLAGFLLLATSFILGKLFSANYPSALTSATVAFVALWF